MDLGKKDYYSKPVKNPSEGRYYGTGVWCNVELEQTCWFFKLPHKNGIQYRVGKPLARDFFYQIFGKRTCWKTSLLVITLQPNV